MSTRRAFLYGGFSVVALSGWLGWRFHRARPEEGIAEVLRKRLHYLRLDAAGIARFASDLLSTDISSAKLRLVTVAGPLYTQPALSGHNVILNAVRQSEERIVSTFLLSSDFFIMGADKHRVVNYLQLFDALRACSNPFARRVQPPA